MDKKIKEAGEKITMPEDMKERIIKACEDTKRENIIRTDSDNGYTDVVSGTERLDTKKRIIRIVSAAAACAVLLAGIGTTGVLLHRQNSNIAGSDVISEAECRSCPFGDFSTFRYSFDAGDGKYGIYSAETYEKLSDFLNKFDWGEPVEKEEGRDTEADVEKPMYNIKWTRGDTPPVECVLHIAKDGYVSYEERMMSFETGSLESLGDIKWYKIDFDAFDIGINNIIGQDTDRISPFGDFREYDFDFQAGIGMYNRHTNGTISDRLTVLLNNFDWGEEQNDIKDIIVLNDYDYTVFWEVDRVISWLYIVNDGYVIYTKNKYDEDYLESTELERKAYRIDITAFEKYFNDIISEDIYIDPSEVEALMTGDCISAMLFDKDRKRIVPETDEIHRQLEYFLRNDFVPMLQINVPDLIYDSELEKYYIEFYFKTDDDNSRYVSFSVLENGVVGCNEYILKDDEREPCGVANYGINIENLESKLAEFGIDFEPKTTSDDDEADDNVSDGSIHDILQTVEDNKQKYLKGYPDVEMVVELRDADDNEIELSDESREKFRTFAENEFKFDAMLKSDPINGEPLQEFLPQVYGIDIRYMSGGKDVLGRYYNIMGDGSVILSDCEYDSDGGSTWTGPFLYYLDLSELYARLEECGAR